jgi:hypothetical protein
MLPHLDGPHWIEWRRVSATTAGGPGPLPYYLRVGVTGHRTIADVAAVDRALRALLTSIAATLNAASAPLEWTIVSPLARGADQIVAAAVLDRPGARLRVVTPLPLEDYRTDFDRPEDLAAFEALLARAESVHQGSPPVVPDAGTRNRAYLTAGERVVDASEIVICIWDGQPARGAGGTADIVAYALERDRMVLWIKVDDPDRGARRLTSVSPLTAEDVPTQPGVLSPGYAEQLAFVNDPTRTERGDGAHPPNDIRDIRQGAGDAGLPPGYVERILESFAPLYTRADRLALWYQRGYRRATHAVLYLAAAAVTIAVAQVLFFPAAVWLVTFEVMAMGGVFAVWWTSRLAKWHEKWLHDRYLAERIRIAMFLCALGAPATRPHPDPLPFYPGPQQWLDAVPAMLARRAVLALPPAPFDALRRFLVDAWLRHQQRHHAAGADEKKRQAHNRHTLGFALFAMTLLMALLHLLGAGHHGDEHVARIARVDLWITFLALVLPVWAASIHAATAQLELERIAARSARMARMLKWLAHRAERAASVDELRNVAFDAAALMGDETREWWALLSFQGVKLHV